MHLLSGAGASQLFSGFLTQGNYLYIVEIPLVEGNFGDSHFAILLMFNTK